jgi:uncharacterized Zn-binding protein involved in type VI secretion
MSKPAARVLDMTGHGTVLKPGTGSPNVSIGGQPAWRGLSPAAAAELAKLIKQIMESVKEFTTATSSNNTVAAGDALKKMKEDISKALQIMGSTDQHLCETLILPPIPPPHGAGVVITGSATVLINGLPACRQGDVIQETISVNSITAGFPTVLIGG